MKPKGYTIFDNGKILGIITLESENAKTGNMAQLWILNRACNPIEAIESGLDENICGQCKHRKVNLNSCYVNVGQAPLSVYNAWKRMNYPALNPENYWILKDYKLRLGAYGDPAFIPYRILSALQDNTIETTGYTHRWKNVATFYRHMCMASVDSIPEKIRAQRLGYRTFRVSSTGKDLQSDEILCPSESRGIECKDCLLCSGSRHNAKSIVITVHGKKKNNFIQFSA